MRYWLVDAAGWQRWFGHSLNDVFVGADRMFRHTNKSGWRIIDRFDKNSVVFTY